MFDLYGGIDPREIPTYAISEAARYLRIPAGTVRSWVAGRRYKTSQGLQYFEPLITTPVQKPRLLSFTNLIEVHVLRAIRKNHQIQLDKVRSALDYIESQLQVSHPLAHSEFRTDGVDLFTDRYGTLINASKSGHTLLRDAHNAHLERIQPDDSGLALKLYPFTRSQTTNSPRLVVIDPRLAFGRLVIAGTGIPTNIVAERYKAGDSMADLADDYNCRQEVIEEVIRCEMQPLAA
ncbi:MAG: DUF433 domain-containing protein [Alkalinema sp. CAN_BIN05]|nr:DUF433 domain-containing protein [Alkalinema sp. CAN_BIN05]